MESKSCSKSISVCEKSSEIVIETVIVTNVNGETSDSVSNNVLIENDSKMAKDGVGCSNISTHDVFEDAVDTVTVVSSNEAENETSRKGKMKEHHIVDLNGEGGSDNELRICRICHFGSDESPEADDDRVYGKSVTPELIEIGCKCKNELALAHYHCAESWFKLKGNSVCEICGCTATNVTVRSMEEWSEVDNTLVERRRRRRHRRGKSCFIFILFVLTIILLHWFFKKFGNYYNNT